MLPRPSSSFAVDICSRNSRDRFVCLLTEILKKFIIAYPDELAEIDKKPTSML